MKTFLKLSLVLGFTSLMLVGCKKDNTDLGSSSGTKIKTETMYYGTQIEYDRQYIYNSNEQCTKIIDADNSYATFEYSNKLYTKKYFKADGTANPNRKDEIYNIGSNGLVSSMSSDNIHYTTYTYDTNGILLLSSYSSGNWTNEVKYTITDGNLIKQTKKNVTIYNNTEYITTDTTTYEYLTDKTNTIGSNAHGTSYFGVDSKNLISKEISSNGTIMSYEYEFNNSGKVTKLTKKNNSGDITWSIKYTY